MNKAITNVENMLLLFSNIRKAYAKDCYKELKSYNFSPNEIDVLIFLSNNQTIDTAKALAICLNISKALVCRSVDSLYQKGLLDKQSDVQDKRICHLILTEDSFPVIRCMQEQKENFTLSILEDVERQDIEQMLQTMHHIHQNILKITKEDERNED